MKKWKLSLIGNVLAAAMLITSLPLNMLPVQAAEASGKEVESATVADWKLGENYAKEGTQIADGTLQMIDQSGNGNDLKMQFYDGKKVTESVPNADVLNENLHFSEETMNGSSDGCMEFDGNSESGKGADLVTVDDAPINQEKFENGYTIEFLYKETLYVITLRRQKETEDTFAQEPRVIRLENDGKRHEVLIPLSPL